MNAREALAAIAAMPRARPLRVMHLCSDHERVIAASEMRRWLSDRVEISAGPGCAAAACPPRDLYQAYRLAQQGIRVLAMSNLMRLPLGLPGGAPASLQQAADAGLDVRPIVAPIDAVVAAQAEPQCEMALFLAGFETLLAPLAGMVLAGLPENLSILLCGRRALPLVERRLRERPGRLDGLILPGNRCAVTGTQAWEQLTADHRTPAAVAGYTAAGILSAVYAVARQSGEGQARVDNCYRGVARRQGNSVARARLARVFATDSGEWRGLGSYPDSAFRLRDGFRAVDADSRYPDYRARYRAAGADVPSHSCCEDVSLGRKSPAACACFSRGCTPDAPLGPSMASEDGACFIRAGGAVAGPPAALRTTQ